MKKLIFILPLLYFSCTDDIVADIDALQTENAEQDAQIDSLLTVITTQQEYIDSMNNVQNAYIDSLISESSLNDSLLQVYTDSLNTVQNTLNADQQAYIDSLINAGNISDDLLQTYIDSLNTVQNTYIDSLHNAQQTTLTALANSALSAGFTPIEVFNGDAIADTDEAITNTELDLTSTLGSNGAISIFKIEKSSPNFQPSITDTNPENDVPYWWNEYHSTPNFWYYFVVTTDGIVYLNTKCQNGGGCAGYTITVTLAFYLNQ